MTRRGSLAAATAISVALATLLAAGTTRAQGRGGPSVIGPPAPVPPAVAIPPPTAAEAADVNPAVKKFIAGDQSLTKPLLLHGDSITDWWVQNDANRGEGQGFQPRC